MLAFEAREKEAKQIFPIFIQTKQEMALNSTDT
jgi:hypothetical protein